MSKSRFKEHLTLRAAAGLEDAAPRGSAAAA